MGRWRVHGCINVIKLLPQREREHSPSASCIPPLSWSDVMEADVKGSERIKGVKRVGFTLTFVKQTSDATVLGYNWRGGRGTIFLGGVGCTICVQRCHRQLRLCVIKRHCLCFGFKEWLGCLRLCLCLKQGLCLGFGFSVKQLSRLG